MELDEEMRSSVKEVVQHMIDSKEIILPVGMPGYNGEMGAMGPRGEPGICHCFLCAIGRYFRGI